MVALLAMTANCCDCAFNEDEVSRLTGIDKDSDDFDEYPDPKQLKEDITPSIIATSALHSVHVVIDSVYSMDNLKAIYRIFCNGDIEKLMPSREEAEKRGYFYSPETLQRQSLAHKGKKHSINRIKQQQDAIRRKMGIA